MKPSNKKSKRFYLSLSLAVSCTFTALFSNEFKDIVKKSGKPVEGKVTVGEREGLYLQVAGN